jgi:hypothetical protein
MSCILAILQFNWSFARIALTIFIAVICDLLAFRFSEKISRNDAPGVQKTYPESLFPAFAFEAHGDGPEALAEGGGFSEG